MGLRLFLKKSEKLFEERNLENYFRKSGMMNWNMAHGLKVAMQK